MEEKIIEGYRLSLQQKNLWLLQGGCPVYRAQCAILIEGDLKPDPFGKALEEVVGRHEILRTTFKRLPGIDLPLQVIAERSGISYREINLEGWGPADQEVELEELYQEDGLLPFNFERGPLVRLSLLTLSESRRVLLVTLPSQCADGRTLENLMGEISRCYEARVEGTAPAGDPVQYVDFAEWQNQALQAEGAEEGRDYWTRQVSSVFPALKLPFEIKPSQSMEFHPASLRLSAVPIVVGKIEGVTRKHDATVAAFLLACWQTLLWRLASGPDVVVGCLFDGRKLGPLHQALGLFAQYLPIACHFEADYRFDEVLRKVGDALRAANEYQEYYQARESISAEDGAAAGVSLPIAFEFWECPPAVSAADVKCTLFRQYVCTDRFKLKLSAIRVGDSLILEVHFDPAFYPREVIERLSEQLETLLREAIREPGVLVSRVDILGKAEKHQLLVAWNETKAEYPYYLTLHELFEEQVEQAPDAIAAEFAGEQVSYGDLNRRANRLARFLMRFGVGCETRVGLLLHRSTEIVEAILATLKAGGVYVPLDPAQPRARLELMLEDARTTVVLTEQRLAGELSHRAARVVCLDSDREFIAQESEANLGEQLSPYNLAYIIYTSGSAGRPKGVMVEHRSVVNLYRALRRAIYSHHGSPLRVSLNAPVAFDGSVKQIIQLLGGHILCIVPEEVRYDGQEMISYLRSHSVDVLDCTPSQLKLMREANGNYTYEAAGLILVGGEALDGELWDELRAAEALNSYNVYGPTECTVDATVAEVRAAKGPPTIGRPIANTQLFLLDALLKPVPVGVTGELHIAGAGVARGYLNRADSTAEKFIPDPFSREPGRRLYRTGDAARYWPDGAIEYVGRLDHQVKVRGYRIELGEIESVLKEHTEVAEAVVVARDDEFGGKRLVAYLVLRQHSTLPVEELRRYLRDRFPDYMVPSAFAYLEHMPLTRNGKVDREALPEPGEVAPDSEQAQTAPRTLVEEILASIWAEVLKVEQVSVGDNFFNLGGHSLLAAQVISRVNEAFKVDLPLRSLFDNSTVAELAERVRESLGGAQQFQTPPIERVPRDEPLPLSFAQQRLWFSDQLEPGNPAYVSTRLIQMTGRLFEAGLEQALGEVWRRHEILRTSFPVVGSQPVQHLSPPQRLILPVVDLSGLSGPQRQSVGQRLFADAVNYPFDLARLPLMRVRLIHLGRQDRVLLVTMHHIIIDGWSISIISDEMNLLYEAFSIGKQSPLDDLPIQYADFACWQQGLQGDLFDAQLSYWKQQLANTSLLDLPMRRAASTGQTFHGAVEPVVLSPELSQALYALSRREGVTLHMTLTAALKTLLYLYTGQEDIILGIGTAGRDRVEIERLVGFFINMLGLRVSLSGNPSFRELLKRVREVALAAYAHQDVPFEKVVAELRQGWDPDRKSLFQVVFSLQNFPFSPLELPDLSMGADQSVNSWWGDLGVAHFDLMLYMFETPQGLTGGFEYNTDSFDQAIIRQMAEYFGIILEKAVVDPDMRLFDLTLIQGEEEVGELLPGSQPEDGDQFNFWL